MAKFRQPPNSIAEATIINKSITANGTYNASADNADGYNPVTVNVPGSGILAGSTIPSDDLGENGNYYYRRSLYTYNDENATSRPSASGTSGQSVCGYKFHTNNNIIVSGLCFYVNNTGVAITVELYDNNNTLLISGTMTPTNTGWNTIPCSDTELLSNNDYYIIARSASAVFSYWSTNLVTVNSSITIIGGVYGSEFNIDNANIYSADFVIKVPTEYTHEYVIGQYYKSAGHWEEIVPV